MLPISPARAMTLAAAMAAPLALAACGGGGGTAGLPDHPITDRAAARALVGGQPLDMTSEAIGGELERIANGSDSLLSSDLHLVTNATRARLTAHCAGASCTFSHPSVPGESLEVGISDWELHDEYQAVMTSGGIPIAQSRSSADLTTGYGGWLEHSGFGAIVQHDATAGEELTAPYAVSYGDASGTNPAGAGTATWSGVMVGADVGSATATERPDLVQGDATVTADLDNADVDVAFTRIVNLGTGGARADMTWTGLPLGDGGFGRGSGEDRIEGRFYGPNHEEAGGVFERDRIVGAFGARREAGHEAASLPDYPIADLAAARTRVGGQSLDTTSEEIGGELDRIANGADSLLMSDMHFISDVTRQRVTADCAGASCTLSHPFVPSASVGIPDLQRYDEYQAVMTGSGIPIAQARRSVALTTGYGGWLEHSVFGTVAHHDATAGQESMGPYAVSYGDASGTNPAGAGTATWSGVMVGSDVGSATATERPDQVQGDATVTADLDNADVDVAFTRIVNLGTGDARADMTWTGLPLSDGGFGRGSGEDRIEGRFHGPNHEEAGGIFERDRIVGAFGARREEDHGSAGLPDYPVTDRAAARTLAGGQPLDTASEGIRGELDRVANGADSLLSSDVHLIADATRERVTADCAGLSCTLSHPSAPSESAGIPDLPLYDEYQAVMTRNGIPIAQARNSADLAIGYGGWLDHNVFGAVVEHDATVGEELMTPYAVSYGDASGTNPAGVGTATWSGVMVGADLGSATATERPDHVQGDATVTADLDNADVDVAFTRIVNLGTGGARADMTWTGLPLSDGGFGQGSGENRIEGRFYGPNHEEAGGIFERDRIVGAFGARRQ